MIYRLVDSGTLKISLVIEHSILDIEITKAVDLFSQDPYNHRDIRHYY